VPVWCGGMLETGVGRAANLALASLPNFIMPADISATERYWMEDIVYESFTINAEDSTIIVPSELGLGVSVNLAQVGRYQLRTEKLQTKKPKNGLDTDSPCCRGG
jgi:O-succinylbenzoate synthase